VKKYKISLLMGILTLFLVEMVYPIPVHSVRAYNPTIQTNSWFETSLLGFTEETTGEYVSFEGYVSSPSAKIGDNPRVRFAMSVPGKVKETYLGRFDTSDGRTLIIKEYTIGFDIAAFTDEEANEYFGNPPYVMHEEELFALEWWDLKPFTGDITGPLGLCLTDEFKDWVRDAAINPTKYYNPNDDTIYGYSNATLKLYGYWRSKTEAEQKFQEIAERQTTGFLDVQVRVEASTWQDVFQDIIVTDTGNFTYTNDIYTRILDVRCVNVRSGYLSQGRRYSLLSNAQNPSSSSDEDPIGDSEIIQSESATFNANEHTTYEDDDSTSTYTAYGEYLEDDSGYISPRTTGYIADGNAENQKMPIWTEEGLPISSLNEGYDSSQTNVDTASFSAFFSLRPETELELYKHKWKYQFQSVGARMTYRKCGFLGLGFCYGKTWYTYRTPINTINSKTVVTGYHVRNVYVISTFYVRVQVGAYYDWHPTEELEDWTGGFGDLGQDQGEDGFPVVVDGTEKGKAEKTFQDIFFGWALDPGAYVLQISMAGLVVLGMWAYWTYQAYDKSRRSRRGQPDAAMGPPWMMAMQQQQQQSRIGRGFFSYFMEDLGKKIIGSIVVFIVMTIIFSIFL